MIMGRFWSFSQICITILNLTLPKGQDEDLKLCISRNVFPATAKFPCQEKHRPDKLNITIMATKVVFSWNLFLNISRVIYHMTCYKSIQCSHWLKLQHFILK